MCQICVPENRSAITVNGITMCHKCLSFFDNLSRTNRRTPMAEIEYQTAWINARRKHNSDGDCDVYEEAQWEDEESEATSVCQ